MHNAQLVNRSTAPTRDTKAQRSAAKASPVAGAPSSDDVTATTAADLGGGLAGVFGGGGGRIRRSSASPPASERLPAAMVDGIARLSGVDVSATRIRRRSDAPGRIGARAFTFGTEVHLGPGHEDRLAHEAWHVVQQSQGRAQRKGVVGVGGVGINVDPSLEREADTMGAQATETAAPAGTADARPASVGEPVLQGDFLTWAWNTLSGAAGYVAGAFGGGAQQPAQQQAPPVVHPPAPVLADPAAIRARLVAAETKMTDAAARLPAVLRGAWQQDEPAFVEAHVRAAFHPLRQLVVFPDALSSTNAEQQTAQIEQNAELYRVYCNDLGADLRSVVEMRTAYRTALTGLSTGLLTTLSQQLEQGTHTAVQTRLVCEQFLEQARVDSARTSDGLQAMMLAGGAQTQQAEGLVKQYFAGGRLRINKWRVGYASAFDAKTGAFGAEWTLRAPDARLKSIADNWVFHTHATADPAGNITISRTQGASHIKPIALAHGQGTSLDFVDEAEFSRAEADQDTQRSFAGWVKRGGWESLRNQNKRV